MAYGYGHPSIILEVVASFDLWIWHAYFSLLGSSNDINVLYDIISACIIMHNMIIDDEVETNWSIVDFNVLSIPKVNIIVEKT